jgi:hypothetical protein
MEKEKEILNIKYRENISPSVDVHHLVSLKNIHIFFEFKKKSIIYRVIYYKCPIAVGVENPHKFWMCRPDRFSLPINDTSLTHVMRLVAHSSTSPTPTAMGQ